MRSAAEACLATWKIAVAWLGGLLAGAALGVLLGAIIGTEDAVFRGASGLAVVGLLAGMTILAQITRRFPAAASGWFGVAGAFLGAAVGFIVKWEDSGTRLGAPFCLSLLGAIAGGLLGKLFEAAVNRYKGRRHLRRLLEGED